MEPLIIPATENTPLISFDTKNLVKGKYIFEISGESRPEDVRQFYTPINQWLIDYNKFLFILRDKGGETRKRKIRFKFRLIYFNSTSAKYFLDILHTLNKIHTESGLADVKVIWIYNNNDEDMYDSGIELKQMTDIPFNLSPLNPEELL